MPEGVPDKTFAKFPNMNSKYKSEFNATAYEFERIDGILKTCDENSARATCLDKSAILPYFSSIKQLYSFLRPFVTLCWKKGTTSHFDKRIDDTWLSVLEWHKEFRENPRFVTYPLGLVKHLDILHTDLLVVKQVFGFGIPLNREHAVKTRIRNYMQVRGGKFDTRFNKDLKVA